MTLNLVKEEPLNLTKNEPLATKLQVGAGWDFKPGHNIDIDLIAYTNTRTVVYFNNTDPLNGSIKCGPDNRSGNGQGIDEFVRIDLDIVPSNVTKITFAISSFSGQNFDVVQGEFIQIKDVSNGNIIAKTTEPVVGEGKTLVFGSLVKSNNEWSFETTLQYDPRGFQDFVKAL